MARRRRNPEIIAGRVNADGSIAAGDGYFTVVKNSTGSWTLTFASGFRVFSVAVSNASSSLTFGQSSSLIDNRAGVVLYNTAGTAVDSPFNFIAVGVQQ
jgi:hypothetical protein